MTNTLHSLNMTMYTLLNNFKSATLQSGDGLVFMSPILTQKTKKNQIYPYRFANTYVLHNCNIQVYKISFSLSHTHK